MLEQLGRGWRISAAEHLLVREPRSNPSTTIESRGRKEGLSRTEHLLKTLSSSVVKVPAAMSNGLSLILGTHMVEGN